MPTNPTDAIANTRVIDAIYRQAGLKIRGSGEEDRTELAEHGKT